MGHLHQFSHSSLCLVLLISSFYRSGLLPVMAEPWLCSGETAFTQSSSPERAWNGYGKFPGQRPLSFLQHAGRVEPGWCLSQALQEPLRVGK